MKGAFLHDSHTLSRLCRKHSVLRDPSGTLRDVRSMSSKTLTATT